MIDQSTQKKNKKKKIKISNFFFINNQYWLERTSCLFKKLFDGKDSIVIRVVFISCSKEVILQYQSDLLYYCYLGDLIVCCNIKCLMKIINTIFKIKN